MATARSYRVILQDKIDPDDSCWVYTAKGLPPSQTSNSAGLIKSVSVVSSDTKQHMALMFVPVPVNRITRNEPFDRFILISFADFKLYWPSISQRDAPRRATPKETGDYITRMLIAGIELNGVHYHFYGHSNSQLKSRSCFLYGASKEDITTKIEGMGDLSKLKSVGKKAKQIRAALFERRNGSQPVSGSLRRHRRRY